MVTIARTVFQSFKGFSFVFLLCFIFLFLLFFSSSLLLFFSFYFLRPGVRGKYEPLKFLTLSKQKQEGRPQGAPTRTPNNVSLLSSSLLCPSSLLIVSSSSLTRFLSFSLLLFFSSSALPKQMHRVRPRCVR